MATATVTKDFDAERRERDRTDRRPTFRLGGTVFTMRTSVKPEVIAAAEEIDEAMSTRETLATLDDVVTAFIDPKGGAHKKYREIRAREDDPVTFQDIGELVRWLVEQYANRPTAPSSSSAAGRKRTGTTSTASSPSKA